MFLAVFLLSLLAQLGSTKDLEQLIDHRQHQSESVLPSHSDDMIAFSAELSEAAELLPGSVVRFDRIRENVVGLYFNNSGQFGCSDEGLYVFIWSTLKAQSSELDGMWCIFKLMKGASNVKYGPNTNFFTSGSLGGTTQMTSVAQCTTNPLTAFTVVTVPWNDNQAAIFREVYTTFSGFRLTSTIAFSAELSHDQYLFPGGPLIFDNILANHGGHYHPLHGLFLCPDNGLYVFSLSVHTPDDETPWSVSCLVLQGDIVMRGPISYLATTSHDSGSASSTVVLQCTQGFTVYAEAESSHDFLFNSYGAELTSFTGFKLYDADVPGAVAFTAVMTNNQTIKETVLPLVFDRTIINNGDAFNVPFDAFVCPDNDIYMLTWTVVVSGNSSGSINLYMDGISIKLGWLTVIGVGETTGTSSMSHVQQCT